MKDHHQFHSCDLCDKQFTDPQKRDNHSKTHRRLKCSECDFECQFPSQLKQHQVKHNTTVIRPGPKLHQCSDCPYRTSYTSHFKRHVNRWHSLQKPTMLSTIQIWEIISRRLLSLEHGVEMCRAFQGIIGNGCHNNDMYSFLFVFMCSF